MIRFSNAFLILIRTIVFGVVVSATSACATTHPASAPIMMGRAVSPPIGLTALCASNESLCVVAARQADDPPIQSGATGGATGAKSNSAIPALVDRSATFENHDSRIEIPFERFEEIIAVNQSVNDRLTWRADLEQYGLEEYWAMPLSFGLPYGDCEDFALEKRQALIGRGFPAAALALATARSQATGLHAVLIVRTTQGDYVLDNTTPWVLPWRETGYRWQLIQEGESLLNWRFVSAA